MGDAKRRPALVYKGGRTGVGGLNSMVEDVGVSDKPGSMNVSLDVGFEGLGGGAVRGGK